MPIFPNLSSYLYGQLLHVSSFPSCNRKEIRYLLSIKKIKNHVHNWEWKIIAMNTCIVYMYVYKHIMVGLHRLLRLLGNNPSFPYRYTLFLKYQQLPRDVFNRDKPGLAVTVSYWTTTTCDKYNLTLKSLPHMISIFFSFKRFKILKKISNEFFGGTFNKVFLSEDQYKLKKQK